LQTPATDGSALIEKFKTMRARMEGFCDWPDDWLEAFTADLARVSGAGQ